MSAIGLYKFNYKLLINDTSHTNVHSLLFSFDLYVTVLYPEDCVDSFSFPNQRHDLIGYNFAVFFSEHRVLVQQEEQEDFP